MGGRSGPIFRYHLVYNIYHVDALEPEVRGFVYYLLSLLIYIMSMAGPHLAHTMMNYVKAMHMEMPRAQWAYMPMSVPFRV